ncbi:MlaD family protein [Nocardia sp. NPDC019395]|uniref:MlaD family protein n=1 Tax=Nocardia sp. NPDC019395 TaxID=3154686 RepID=UPI0033E86D94
MSYRKPLIGLSIFLVIALVLTWMVHLTLQRGVSGETDSYAAVFTDVSGLRSGDDVRMAGVKVGRVDTIAVDGTHARVTFEVTRDQTLYGNTLATVTYQNLIGQRYLGLAPDDSGSPERLEPGSVIPVEHTEPSFDISGLLNGFQPLFSMLDPQDVDNITAALVRALQGEDGAVLALITQTSSLVESFAGPDQVLGSIIDNLGRVLADLAQHSGELQTTIAQTRKIFDGLHARRDTLLTQTTEIATVLDRAAQVVQGAAPSLAQFVTREPGFARHFLDNKQKFGYLGANLPPMLKSLSRITDEGAYLDAYICDLGFSMVPGFDPLMAQILALASPSGQVEHSAICR